jgi:hypothetical protein
LINARSRRKLGGFTLAGAGSSFTRISRIMAGIVAQAASPAQPGTMALFPLIR